MDDGAGAEEIVMKVYRRAKEFLKGNSYATVMASGNQWLIRKYEFYQELVEGVDNLLTEEYYRRLLF